MRPIIKKGTVRIVKINTFLLYFLWSFSEGFYSVPKCVLSVFFEDFRSITENLGTFYLNLQEIREIYKL
jgi:hypothetical protein